MTKEDLLEDIDIQLESMETIVNYSIEVLEILKEKDGSIIQKTALASFASQFYHGIENILKRISKYYNVQVPSSSEWHSELMKRFSDPPYMNLPVIFNEELSNDLVNFRKFRHYVIHGYSFNIEWPRLRNNLANIQEVFIKFKNSLELFMQSI
jgi:hypothetical protein